MLFDTRVNGIPCQCHVLHFEPEVPMRITGSGMGDADPPEPAEFAFEILDTKGRKAPWLEKYVNEVDSDRLYEEFLYSVKAEDYCVY